MRLRAVASALTLHHVSSRHVNTAVTAGLHGAGFNAGCGVGPRGF